MKVFPTSVVTETSPYELRETNISWRKHDISRDERVDSQYSAFLSSILELRSQSMSRQNQFFGWAGKWRLKGKDQRKFEVKPLTATVDLGLILLDRRDRSGLYPWAGITSPVCE
ncbi:hypothetical protein TWF106_011195 [Orbilia oligospora]|uniref:Uncharacterized protein n=1 Tax=Orbilia oligospora TaxID=2813651 RepID=A0A6G1MJJ7_ORBOL|nr:hypothetical protein TWF788_007564 [Orbilia oligospora]KAF3206614.1 hypothetical protein TWF679_008658 [Orbilia oligospora]KAF3226783.1 hypothetical protein TWF106_011195 [Orbilia oligospora]KAF3229503.1 hypothetical protein TWF191_001225 [Orbilia oligospora]KAF3258352.1 hypothetical protein TWF192_000483 [Orbilia oligospora]